MSAAPRHRWCAPDRRDWRRTVRRCENCDVRRITRHEPGEHSWQEFERGGRVIARAGDGTPPCDQARLRLREGRTDAAARRLSIAILTDNPAAVCRAMAAEGAERLGCAIVACDPVRWRGRLADGRRFQIVFVSDRIESAWLTRAAISGFHIWEISPWPAERRDAVRALAQAGVERGRGAALGEAVKEGMGG